MGLTSFKDFMAEEVSNSHDNMVDVSHLHLHHNHEGVGHAANVLADIHQHLLGNKTKADIVVPYEGHPSVRFGSKRGKFYAHVVNGSLKEDAAPDILSHLQKIMPREGGEYGGVIMHTKDTTKKVKDMMTATPGQTTYSTHADGVEGKKMKNAHLGIVIDHHYVNGKATDMTSKQRAKFVDHPDVNHIDPTLRVNPLNYTPDEQHAFMTHLKNAQVSYTKMKPEALEAIAGHAGGIQAHMDHYRSQGGLPSAESYLLSLKDAHQKALLRGNNLAEKDKKNLAYNAMVQDAFDNKGHIEKAIELGNHLHDAKNVLLGVAAKNSPYMHSMGGQVVEPAGLVHMDRAGNKVKVSR